MSGDLVIVEVDASRAFLKVARIDNATRTALRGTIISLTKALGGLVRSKLSGGVLNRRTGALYDSIAVELVENPTTIYGRVFVRPSSPAARYARIHEFGGVINHPGSNKFQAWQGAGGWVYTNKTKPHKIPMPQRSYMRSSLADMQQEIVARMSGAVRSAAGVA